jgi:phosphohistidine phosphatase
VKKIILVRHATAAKKNPKDSDFDRVLKKGGRKEARDMSKRLKDIETKPALFISSTAPRALETARLFAKAFDYPAKKIDKREEFYGGMSTGELLRLIKGLDDGVDSVMVFGHDPTFTEFARHMLSGLEEPMPKCGVVGIAADATTWMKVTPAVSKKEYFLHPSRQPSAKVMRKALRRDLGVQIEQNIARALSDFGINDSDKVRKVLRRVSTKLAKRLASQAGTRQSTGGQGDEPGSGRSGEK